MLFDTVELLVRYWQNAGVCVSVDLNHIGPALARQARGFGDNCCVFALVRRLLTKTVMPNRLRGDVRSRHVALAGKAWCRNHANTQS